MALRKLSPGGYEYLTGAVVCADRELGPGESLADYYFAHGYPPGDWFGQGARALGVSGQVTQAQMTALFGEGRHPNADAIAARMIRDEGPTAEQLNKATMLGRAFASYGGWDDLRSATIAAYKAHNLEHGRPVGAPIDETTRTAIRAHVHRNAFAEAHGGRQPADPKELNRWLDQQKQQLKTAVAGYEMVFAPPKSVSVAWALADTPTRKMIASAHRQAVHDALVYFETNAAYTRRGNLGEAQVDVDGIIATRFEHWDSRTGDPHLHTHVPISNKVKRSDDGKWTSLDGRTVFASNVPVSEFYNSRLRDLLREHGASWTEKPASKLSGKRPVWELDGVPQRLLDGFSQRSAQVEGARARGIVAFRRTHGREPNPKELLEISKQAQYATRTRKQPPRTLGEHVAEWRAAAVRMVGADIVRTLGRRIFPAPTASETVAESRAAQHVEAGKIYQLARRVVRTVEAHHAHFTAWNIEAEVHRQTAGLPLAPGRRETVVAAVVEAALRLEGTVCLQPPALVAEPDMLRRRDGQSVFTPHQSARYTTTRTLRAEGDLVDAARRVGGHRVSNRHVARAQFGERLNTGQRDLVTAFSTSGRRVQLALAPAGSGKTTAMRVLTKAWRSSGGRVFAFGPSARAAQELGDTIGARPHTLHQLTTALDLGIAEKTFGLRPGDLLIIDEAVMAGTHTLRAVIAHALASGADVRLVGDDHQLGAFEAGGAVALIAREVGAERLWEIVRFHDPRQAAASLQIRAGDRTGLDYYFGNGWVRGGSRETMRDDAHHRWRRDLDRGRHSLLIVPAIDDVVALNLQARAQRIDRGFVDPGRAVALHDGTSASVGDYIVSRYNNRRLPVRDGSDFVKNGDTWRVDQVHRDGSLTVTHRAHGDTVTLPPSYAAANVELAYAATINRVQGMTSDTSHQLAPATLTREQLYTGLTRGQHANHLYIITHHHVADQHQETPADQTTRGVLENILQRRGIDTSATDTLRQGLLDAESLGTLVGHYNYVARLNDHDRYLNILEAHAPETLHQPAEPALIQTLRNSHDLGWNSHDLLAHTELASGIDEARDPAALLAWRIDRHTRDHAPPPARNLEPHAEDVARWRKLVTIATPAAPVTDPAWQPVWQAAADGKSRGLNADAAVYDAAARLAERPPDYYRNDPAYTSGAVRAALDDQHARGHGHTPALPWLARADFTTINRHHGLRAYLDDLNAAIAARTHELHATATRDVPAWAARLGPRPDNPVTAERWDRALELAAAYRDTFQITTNDPNQPLGPQPDTNGLRARAWRDISHAWTHPPAPEPTSVTQQPREVTLPDLIAQHDALARTGDTARYRELISHPAPTALNRPGEDAVIGALRTAHDLGWQPEHLLNQQIIIRGIDDADDPAALLAWRINNHMRRHTPPPRTRQPDPADIARWRTIASAALPKTALDSPEWQHAWRIAATASSDGLDPDTAVDAAARALTTNRAGTPANPSDAVTRALRDERNAGAGHTRALPWLARPDFTTLDPTQTRQLCELNGAIRQRTRLLRADATTSRPAWTRSLGPRPTDPVQARRWDRTLELAAAYRATHNITSTNPDRPLGTQPRRDGTQARSWQHITNEWRTIMPTPNDPKRRNASHETTASAARVAAHPHYSDRENRADVRRRASERRHRQLRGADDPYTYDHDDYQTHDHHGSHSGLRY